MSTVDKAFANNIIRHNGYYEGRSDNSLGDNPRCDRIIRYTNAWGKDAYGLLFEGQANKYTESLYVISPEIYWQYSPDGERFGTFWTTDNAVDPLANVDFTTSDTSDDDEDEDAEDYEEEDEEEEDTEDEDEDD